MEPNEPERKIVVETVSADGGLCSGCAMRPPDPNRHIAFVLSKKAGEANSLATLQMPVCSACRYLDMFRGLLLGGGIAACAAGFLWIKLFGRSASIFAELLVFAISILFILAGGIAYFSVGARFKFSEHPRARELMKDGWT